jgi:drug/metabolite transporter (DMT)-like permease
VANQVRLGIICALAAAGLYGLMPNFVRAAYLSGIPAVEATFFRTLVIAIVLAVVAALRRESFFIPAVARPAFAAQSIATLAISICYLVSVQFIPVGLAVTIFFTFPVLIMLVSPIMEHHTPGVIPLMIALLAFAGLYLALGPSFSSLDPRGLLLAAAASIGAVVQFYSGRALSKHMTPAVFGSLVHLGILPFTLAIALLVSHGSLQMLPGGTGTSTGILFLCGVAAVYVIAYLLQMLSLRFAATSRVAPFYNLEPVMTTIVAGLLLGERLEPAQYAGGGLVLVALGFASGLAKKDA